MTRDTFDMFQEPERGRFGDNEAAAPRSKQRVTGASDLIDLVLCLRNDAKPLAIAVSDPAAPGAKWIWLPRSQIEVEEKSDGLVEVTMPQWLAKDKGLI